MNKAFINLGKHMIDPYEIVYVYESILTKVVPDEDDIPCIKILFKNNEWINVGGVTVKELQELMEKLNEKE